MLGECYELSSPNFKIWHYLGGNVMRNKDLHILVVFFALICSTSAILAQSGGRSYPDSNRPKTEKKPTKKPKYVREPESATQSIEVEPATEPVPEQQPPKPPRPLTVPVMVRIPAGSFEMGANNDKLYERPAHTVQMHSFEIGAYEVTNEEFEAFVDDTGYKTEPETRNASITWRSYFVEGRDKFPVVLVSWHDANNFCKWISSKTGDTYRLPTEAEWEYAARGGQEQKEYPWGDEISAEYANYDAEGTRKVLIGIALDHVRRVGSYKPNGFGLYDVVGNVWEWCSDWFGERYYSISPDVSPKGPEVGIFKVMRGASWMDQADVCRITYRGYNSVNYSAPFLGFRVVRELKKQ